MKVGLRMASLWIKPLRATFLTGVLLSVSWVSHAETFVLDCLQVNGLADDSFLLDTNAMQVSHLEPKDPITGDLEISETTYRLLFVKTSGTLWEWRINRLTGEYFWEAGSKPLFDDNPDVREKNRWMHAWGNCARRSSKPKL